jgi:hypothetical protein
MGAGRKIPGKVLFGPRLNGGEGIVGQIANRVAAKCTAGMAAAVKMEALAKKGSHPAALHFSPCRKI